MISLLSRKTWSVQLVKGNVIIASTSSKTYGVTRKVVWFSDDVNQNNNDKSSMECSDQQQQQRQSFIGVGEKMKMDVAEMRARFRRQQQQQQQQQRISNTAEPTNEQEVLQQQGEVWNSLWEDSIIPWDIGISTAALYYELNQYYCTTTQLADDDDSSCTIIRILVPGCGAGYDLVPIARHFDNLLAQKNIQQQSTGNNNDTKIRKTAAVVVGLDLTRPHVITEALHNSPTLQHTRIDLVMGDFSKVQVQGTFLSDKTVTK
jgi:Thiopurine S-methyltransferase (TPMT)